MFTIGMGQVIPAWCTPHPAPHRTPCFWPWRSGSATALQRPAEPGLRAVWRRDLGVMTMKQGEVAVITASPENAYGADGFPSWGILPNSTLRFEIEVLQC